MALLAVGLKNLAPQAAWIEDGFAFTAAGRDKEDVPFWDKSCGSDGLKDSDAAVAAGKALRYCLLGRPTKTLGNHANTSAHSDEADARR